jgi:hypothetical protein
MLIIMGCNHRIAATLRTLELVPTQPAVQALSPCFAFCGTRRLINLPCSPQASGPYPVSLEYFNIIVRLLFISLPQSDLFGLSSR